MSLWHMSQVPTRMYPMPAEDISGWNKYREITVSTANNLIGIRPWKSMTVYTRVPSFSSTVDEFLTGSESSQSTIDLSSLCKYNAYQNRGALVLHERLDGPDGRSEEVYPENQ